MDMGDLFAAADASIARMDGGRAVAAEAAAALARIVSAALDAGHLPQDAVREAKALASAEAAYLSSLPGEMEGLVRSLDGAKVRYLPTERQIAPPKRGSRGLAASLGWRRKEDGAQVTPSSSAQAAYAGRVERMEKGAAIVDLALSAIPARRKEIGALIFRLQEMAVGMAGAGARDIHAVEDAASALLAHLDALALHGRLLSSIDRTGEEGQAVALEAHMDGLVNDLPG